MDRVADSDINTAGRAAVLGEPAPDLAGFLVVTADFEAGFPGADFPAADFEEPGWNLVPDSDLYILP